MLLLNSVFGALHHDHKGHQVDIIATEVAQHCPNFDLTSSNRESGVRIFDLSSRHCPEVLYEFQSDLDRPTWKFCPNPVSDLPTDNQGS
jgi:hypothetical protein